MSDISSVTLHTTLGDLKIEVFCEAVPRTAENFLALAASGTYDNTLFHRNIKGFMVQGGDPSGTGKGGQSIWGKPFADEIRQTLKFNTRGIVAMANGGPDTNKSQFFIAYGKQPSLDGKYTIFGKYVGPGRVPSRHDSAHSLHPSADSPPSSHLHLMPMINMIPIMLIMPILPIVPMIPIIIPPRIIVPSIAIHAHALGPTANPSPLAE
ncbi:Peptidyl-prolyl cis-trans isomerase cyp10 [Saitozyma podzolica]|uniref:Peptidyl-prolyl cis-trans isomerase n=1 Tax=Saitozyma podzolica TaxID=1890683 RepID=A0A427YRG8_9TREE|nr:Peptidyl-prolyl cis-trans isomerase cyp10 [Saitozyma podzolica]